jgi:sugar diacid utilization regulator
VISAVPTQPSPDEHGLRAAAAALSRASGAARPPLTVLRRGEIVVVVADPPGRGRALGRRLEDARRRLAASGVSLAIAGSTVHDNVADLPHAYQEALAARERVLPGSGVLALTALTAFEYVTSRGDDTARRLVSPEIGRFITEDARHGGVLLETLQVYVASDLNVRQAAERLHLHVNTAHYRLSRIAERTGCDLRRIADVMEILIAARLAGKSRSPVARDVTSDNGR